MEETCLRNMMDETRLNGLSATRHTLQGIAVNIKALIGIFTNITERERRLNFKL